MSPDNGHLLTDVDVSRSSRSHALNSRRRSIASQLCSPCFQAPVAFPTWGTTTHCAAVHAAPALAFYRWCLARLAPSGFGKAAQGLVET